MKQQLLLEPHNKHAYFDDPWDSGAECDICQMGFNEDYEYVHDIDDGVLTFRHVACDRIRSSPSQPITDEQKDYLMLQMTECILKYSEVIDELLRGLPSGENARTFILKKGQDIIDMLKGKKGIPVF